jgi:hypothetical protein
MEKVSLNFGEKFFLAGEQQKILQSSLPFLKETVSQNINFLGRNGEEILQSFFLCLS